MRTDLTDSQHYALYIINNRSNRDGVWYPWSSTRSLEASETLDYLLSRGLVERRPESEGHYWVRTTEDGKFLARIYGEP